MGRALFVAGFKKGISHCGREKRGKEGDEKSWERESTRGERKKKGDN